MWGPWAVPSDDPSMDNLSDKLPSGPEINWDFAKSTASLKAALGHLDDPDDDGFTWYPVLDG